MTDWHHVALLHIHVVTFVSLLLDGGDAALVRTFALGVASGGARSGSGSGSSPAFLTSVSARMHLKADCGIDVTEFQFLP